MIFKEVRKSKGISRLELAEKACVGAKTIYNIESGSCIGRRETIEMINKVLELRLPYEEYYDYMKILKSGQLKELIDFESNVKKYEGMINKLYEAEKLHKECKHKEAFETYLCLSTILHKEIEELIKIYKENFGNYIIKNKDE